MNPNAQQVVVTVPRRRRTPARPAAGTKPGSGPGPDTATVTPLPQTAQQSHQHAPARAHTERPFVPPALPPRVEARSRGLGIAAHAARIASRRRALAAEARKNARRKHQRPAPPRPAGPTRSSDHLVRIADLVAAWDDLLACATAVNEAYNVLLPHERPWLAYIALSADFGGDGTSYSTMLLGPEAEELGYVNVPIEPLARGVIPAEAALLDDDPQYDAVMAHTDEHQLVIDVRRMRTIDFNAAQDLVHAKIRALSKAATRQP